MPKNTTNKKPVSATDNNDDNVHNTPSEETTIMNSDNQTDNQTEISGETVPETMDTATAIDAIETANDTQSEADAPVEIAPDVTETPLAEPVPAVENPPVTAAEANPESEGKASKTKIIIRPGVVDNLFNILTDGNWKGLMAQLPNEAGAAKWYVVGDRNHTPFDEKQDAVFAILGRGPSSLDMMAEDELRTEAEAVIEKLKTVPKAPKTTRSAKTAATGAVSSNNSGATKAPASPRKSDKGPFTLTTEGCGKTTTTTEFQNWPSAYNAAVAEVKASKAAGYNVKGSGLTASWKGVDSAGDKCLVHIDPHHTGDANPIDVARKEVAALAAPAKVNKTAPAAVPVAEEVLEITENDAVIDEFGEAPIPISVTGPDDNNEEEEEEANPGMPPAFSSEPPTE